MYLLPNTPIFRVPDDLPDSVAVLTEIMAVTHGVETAQSLLGLTGGYRFGNSVAVLGTGPLGLCHLIKARLLGAAKLIATDLFPSRLALAQEFGATLTMQADQTEPEERIARAREHTDGLGPDIVLDCSGFPADLRRGVAHGAPRWCRRGSRHVRRHGAGRHQSEQRHLHPQCQRDRRWW